jgi:hypothetical protein
MAVGRTLNTGPQKGSDMHLWLQVVQADGRDFMTYLALQVNTQMHDGRGTIQPCIRLRALGMQA